MSTNTFYRVSTLWMSKNGTDVVSANDQTFTTLEIAKAAVARIRRDGARLDHDYRVLLTEVTHKTITI
ncbi:MAG: hypothetical protein EHM78_01905 [Myxococcaceae bacterium]|nr:MAG: hypothetical protein EHM78_01905 [Myxococcaceae bacterium]